MPHAQKFVDVYRDHILSHLAQAANDARTLADIIHAAECRIAAVLAIIDGDRVAQADCTGNKRAAKVQS